jgi:Holliday junction resolvase
MADTPEKKVKNAVRKVLDRLGIYYFMPPGMGLGRSGIPDIIGCYQGRFIAIECKAGKGKTTALQERELQWIKDAGGFTFVAREDNLEEMEGRLLLWIS